jgi:hypothetical protein
MSATFRDVTIPPEEAVILFMHFEMMLKDPAERITVITDCYIAIIHNSDDPEGTAA